MRSIAAASESRVILRNVLWETYEALIDARGNDPTPRFTYDTGTLEIMSPSRKHEKLKKLIGRLIEAFTEEQGIQISSAGSVTLRNQLKEKGLEPDESYYVQNEPRVRGKDDLDLTIDPPPDLAIEVDLSASSMEKLAIYAGLQVPEVWSLEECRVRIHQLQDTGEYLVVETSKVLPALPAKEIDRVLSRRTEVGETTLIRSFREWVRSSFRA